jgi:uncharacterized membrane protein
MSKKRLIIAWIVGILLIIWIFTIYKIDYIKRNPLPPYYQSKFEEDHKKWEKEVWDRLGSQEGAAEVYAARLKWEMRMIEDFENMRIRNVLRFSMSISLAILTIGVLSICTSRGKRK